MAKDYTKVLSEILLVLKNLNDNIRNCEKTLITICSKLSKMETENCNKQTHEIIIRKEIKTIMPTKEIKGGK